MADEKKGKRIFVYDSKEFPDPDPSMKVDDIRRAWVEYFPELSNAEVKEAKRGDDTVYTFTKRVGTKGAKVTVEVEIPDGRFCDGDKKDCPFFQHNEDTCTLLGVELEFHYVEAGNERLGWLKASNCPNPEKK